MVQERLQGAKGVIQEKDQAIECLRAQILDLRDQAATEEKALAFEKIDRAVHEKDQAIEERDRAVGERDRAVEERDRAVQGMDQAIESLQCEMRGRKEALEERDLVIQETAQLLEKKDQELQSLQCEARGSEEALEERERVIQETAQLLEKRDQELQSLQCAMRVDKAALEERDRAVDGVCEALRRELEDARKGLAASEDKERTMQTLFQVWSTAGGRAHWQSESRSVFSHLHWRSEACPVAQTGSTLAHWLAACAGTRDEDYCGTRFTPFGGPPSLTTHVSHMQSQLVTLSPHTSSLSNALA